MQTVYADVLILLNTYVNFALLHISALIDRQKVKRLRIFAAALFGGIYSLIILCDNISAILVFLTKAAVSLLMVLIAFGFNSPRGLLRLFAVFFAVSFVFAGLMLALWLFVSPQNMLFNNAVVYFSFDTVTLLVFTALSYALVRLILLFSQRHTPKGSIYDIEIETENTVIKCQALCDSGSSLCDWYTSLPVILISPELADKLLPDFSDSLTKSRLIPAVTAGGETLIRIFKPRSIHIKGVGCEIENAQAYIGISNTKLCGGEFKAIIPYSLIREEKEKCLKN